ncbi:bacteriocin [Reinekea forsetii]|nr:bacteriocin [Reinekea forsetii]
MNTLSNDQMNQVSGGALVTLFKAVIKGAGYVGTAITVSYNSYKAAKKKASRK